MTETELKNKAIVWLETQSKKFKNRPHAFTPKEVAEAVGGAYSTLGNVAAAVVAELLSRDVNIRYLRIGNKRLFELR